jgi:hypothetical protein
MQWPCGVPAETEYDAGLFPPTALREQTTLQEAAISGCIDVVWVR